MDVRQLVTAERHLPPKCTNFGFFTTKVYEFCFFFLRKCTNIGASRDVPDVPRRTSVSIYDDDYDVDDDNENDDVDDNDRQGQTRPYTLYTLLVGRN